MAVDLTERDQHGWLKWTEYVCTVCQTGVTAPRFGLPETGWDLTNHAGKDPNRRWFLCSLPCVARFAADEQTGDNS